MIDISLEGGLGEIWDSKRVLFLLSADEGDGPEALNKSLYGSDRRKAGQNIISLIVKEVRIDFRALH